ncbi:MAG: hypothetical protein R3B09_19635 [Nannocystaceae bacterium]
MQRRWMVFGVALGLCGCSSSDLDDLCKSATTLVDKRETPVIERVDALFKEWKPESRNGQAIKAGMIREGEIASYGVFRKLIAAKASTQWTCPAIERLMVEPVADDAQSLCVAAGGIVASEVESRALGARLAQAWTPTSYWGHLVHEALRSMAIEDIAGRIRDGYRGETGKAWECPALDDLIRGALRRDVESWCEMATMVDAGPTGQKPIHTRRAKMSQLTGESLGFDLEGLRRHQEEVGAERCPALERVLGLVDVERTIDVIDEATGTDTGGVEAAP